MRLKVRYGRVEEVPAIEAHVDEDREPNNWHLTTVVNDLLGLRADPNYMLHMFRYLPFAPFASDGRKRKSNDDHLASLAGMVEAGVPGLFEKAVITAMEGYSDPGLAPHAARVRYHDADDVEIDDVLALGAFALQRRVQRGPLHVYACLGCGRPWIAKFGAGGYCNRPLAGSEPGWCSSGVRVKKHADTHREYYLQRRRLYDRKRRGTLPEGTYKEWLAVNHPGELGTSWVSFEDWQAGKRPKAATTKKASAREEKTNA